MVTIEKKKIPTQEDLMNLLDSCYAKCLINSFSKPIPELAEDYLSRYKTKEEACKAMLNNQVTKCTTSGILTGLGGVVTMSISIPANVCSVLYFQMRMIACTAYMAGYDLESDQTQTFIYACLVGVSLNSLAKKTCTKIGTKIANNMIKKIPGKVLAKINKKVQFRLVTKFGSKGVLNLGKMVPGVGAAIGGCLDFTETRIIANRAYKWFMENDFVGDDAKFDDGVEILDADFEDVEC